MECFDVKSKLGFYFDHELQTDEMELVTAHLSQCAQCQLELSQLQEIETAVRSGIYEEPLPDYWSKTPQIITHRLDLTDKEPALPTKLMTVLKRLFPESGLRWGLAGGLAVAVLLILSLNVFNLQNQQELVGQQPISEQTEETLSSTQSEGTPVVDSEAEPAIGTAKQEAKPELTSDKSEHAENLATEIVIGTRNLALSQVPAKTLETGSGIPARVKHELRPVPASHEIVRHLLAREEKDVHSPDVNTLSLEQRLDSKHLDITNSTDGLSELESDYLETVKIVEESTTLEEKRNIWLSYISRQDNFTYKTLGIYHLALVLYDIADLKYDRDKAREAIDFYRKEEETLRFQMGDQEYEARVSALDLILVQ